MAFAAVCFCGPESESRATHTLDAIWGRSAGSVEVGILAHLNLNLLALLFGVHEHLAVAEVSAFDLSLGLSEELAHAFDLSGGGLAEGLVTFGLVGSEAGEEEFVVEGEELAIGSGIALAPASADQLAVDAGGIVHFGANDVQSAEFLDMVLELDVGAAAGHVRGDGHFVLQAGAGDDIGLLLDLMGVEDLVLDLPLGEQFGEMDGLVDGSGTDEDGAPFGMEAADFVDDGGPFPVFAAEDEIREPLADDGAIGGDDDDGGAIDLAELARGGGGRAGHAGEVLVAEEEILDGDASGLACGDGDVDARLGLDGLVDSLAPLAAFGEPAGELVDDDDLAVADNELAVLNELALDLDGTLDVLVDVEHADVVERFGLGEHADLVAALAGELDGLLVVIVVEVDVFLELVTDGGAPLVAFDLDLLGLGGDRADDERGAGFVDEDAVGFVDEGEEGFALDGFVATGHRMAEHAAEDVALAFVHAAEQEAIAEEIEAELLGGAVGQVAGVGLAALGLGLLGLDGADGEAEGLIDGAHPLGVAAGEVVVDGGEMAALAGQRVEIHGERGGEGLAFAGLHLDDGAVEHGDAAKHLDVEVAHVECAPSGLTHKCEGFGHEAGEGFAAAGAVAQAEATLAEVVVAELEQLGLEGGNSREGSGPVRELSARGEPEERQELVGETGEHRAQTWLTPAQSRWISSTW